MSKIAVGAKVPAFSAQTTDGEAWKLADAAGRKVVLYFYPKDMTSGCTLEARGFRRAVLRAPLLPASAEQKAAFVAILDAAGL